MGNTRCQEKEQAQLSLRRQAMKFQMMDGHVYEGRTYKAVVESMAGDKLRRPRDLDRYRTGVVRRIEDALGIVVDDSTNTKFIQSMQAHGLMEKLP